MQLCTLDPIIAVGFTLSFCPVSMYLLMGLQYQYLCTCTPGMVLVHMRFMFVDLGPLVVSCRNVCSSLATVDVFTQASTLNLKWESPFKLDRTFSCFWSAVSWVGPSALLLYPYSSIQILVFKGVICTCRYATSTTMFSPQPPGNFFKSSFQSGHLCMRREYHPKLLALAGHNFANPTDILHQTLFWKTRWSCRAKALGIIGHWKTTFGSKSSLAKGLQSRV